MREGGFDLRTYSAESFFHAKYNNSEKVFSCYFILIPQFSYIFFLTSTSPPQCVAQCCLTIQTVKGTSK
jgi:hypothetical protein